VVGCQAPSASPAFRHRSRSAFAVPARFLYAHIGWIFLLRNGTTDYESVSDLARLLWLERHSYLPPAALALFTWLVAGWPGLTIGFCWSTVAVWHVTFSIINSLSHLIGRRPYITGDQSRNTWLLALLTMGEGWHNNHYANPSVRQGFRGGNLTRRSTYCASYLGSDSSGICMCRLRLWCEANIKAGA